MQNSNPTIHVGRDSLRGNVHHRYTAYSNRRSAEAQRVVDEARERRLARRREAYLQSLVSYHPLCTWRPQWADEAITFATNGLVAATR